MRSLKILFYVPPQFQRNKEASPVWWVLKLMHKDTQLFS